MGSGWGRRHQLSHTLSHLSLRATQEMDTVISAFHREEERAGWTLGIKILCLNTLDHNPISSLNSLHLYPSYPLKTQNCKLGPDGSLHLHTLMNLPCTRYTVQETTLVPTHYIAAQWLKCKSK